MSDPTEEREALARRYLDLERPADALRELGPLLVGHPDDPDLLLLAGRARLALGEPEEAARLAGRAAALAPDSSLPHRVTASALSVQGRHREALAAALQAERLAPDDWGAAYSVAFVGLRGKGLPRDAVRAAERLVELAPDEPDALDLAGRVQLVRRRRLEAGRLFKAALRIDPSHGGAADGLALLRAQSGRIGAAAGPVMERLARDPRAEGTRATLEAIGTRALWMLGLPLVVAAQIDRITTEHAAATAALPDRVGEVVVAVGVPVVWVALVVAFRLRVGRRFGAFVRAVARAHSLVVPYLGALLVALGLLVAGLLQPPPAARGLDAAAGVLAFIAMIVALRVLRPGRRT